MVHPIRDTVGQPIRKRFWDCFPARGGVPPIHRHFLHPDLSMKLAWIEPIFCRPGEAMQEVLTPEEADRFAAHLRPLVERGHGHRRIAASYPGAIRSTPKRTVTVSTAWG
jgi:hypothetical protein